MKTKLIIFSLLLSFSLAVFAQEAGFKTPFERNETLDNWFIHIGVGAQTIAAENDDEAKFLDRITLAPTVSIGKWFSPYWGVRVKGQGGSLHGFENSGTYMQHIRYVNVHLDAMWNLSNYWGVYSPTKVFNFTPYLGLGYAHKFAYDEDVSVPLNVCGIDEKKYHEATDALSVNGGIQFGFRLSRRINLDFDLGAAVVPEYFDRVERGVRNEAIFTATGGLTFKLGKTDFQAVEPMDDALLGELNSRINSLRAEVEELSKRPASCPTCPDVAPTIINEINYVPNVVFFRINSAKVDDNQKVSIYNTAEFVKETDEKIKVVGYADKNTGSDAYNLKLSEQRAKAVANELINSYGIPSNKIVVEWKGASEQPYKENKWNRIVVMSAE